MGKSNNDRRRNASNDDYPRKRNNVAYGMITSGTGIARVHNDKRDKRAKRERLWEEDNIED
jgi:hypothetical protein